ncbi:hypothetical protein [Gilvimarinus sp. 1_MG-2023]|uniref:hypothetical protein n=1 Tax=Gilvimarinus sp. 1_MG-2023 TaxID=3062638 RepID=UPI0026E2B1D8|nr:hypothetical protein [Gilvimarinus sp. 1_MG-2023]MDO6748567.1 hypothetical protein [Gilvimarinus sp. 1_MG-2023]
MICADLTVSRVEKNCHLPAAPVYIMERGKVEAIGALADLNEDLVQKYLSA